LLQWWGSVGVWPAYVEEVSTDEDGEARARNAARRPMQSSVTEV
jgi:hypothetical protein